MTRGEALEILGLDSDASLDEAREAYRTLAKTYHPDKNPASNATAMFRIISDAWEVIQNTAEQEHSEAEIKQQQAEAEAARRRDAEEAARRRAEAEEERKRAQEEQRTEARAAQAEEIRRHKKEKKTEKVIKRLCYLGWFILTLVGVLRSFNNQLVGVLRSFNNQNVVHLINIFYSIFTVCLGTIGYGWLTGWLIIKCRKKWFFKKGKEDNVEVKILFRSCLAWFIFGICLCLWDGSVISDLIFGLQLDDPLAPQWYDSQFNKFLLFMLNTNVIFLCTIFGTLFYTVLFGGITGSIIIKTNEWFQKKRLKN